MLKVWSLSPLNAANNLQGVGAVGRSEVSGSKDNALVARQEAMVRQLVTEWNGFDNVYYEIGTLDFSFTCDHPDGTANVTQAPGEAYAVYLRGSSQSELTIDIPAGHFLAEWINPCTGQVEKTDTERPFKNRNEPTNAKISDFTGRCCCGVGAQCVVALPGCGSTAGFCADA